MFASETSKATAKFRRSVKIAAVRGAALGEDIGDVVGTSLDKGVELDALEKAPEEERKSLIARAKAGENVSARRAPITRHGVQRAKGAGAPSQPGP